MLSNCITNAASNQTTECISCHRLEKDRFLCYLLILYCPVHGLANVKDYGLSTTVFNISTVNYEVINLSAKPNAALYTNPRVVRLCVQCIQWPDGDSVGFCPPMNCYQIEGSNFYALMLALNN